MENVKTNELPYIFPSWNNLRNFLVEANLFNDDSLNGIIFDISHNRPKNGNLIKYSFSTDFIKARCFDEFLSLGITKNNVLKLTEATFRDGIISGYEHEVLEKFREMLYLYDSRYLNPKIS